YGLALTLTTRHIFRHSRSAPIPLPTPQLLSLPLLFFFFFNDTATTEIYTLSLQRRSSDLKLAPSVCRMTFPILASLLVRLGKSVDRKSGSAGMPRPISYAVFCLKKKKKKNKKDSVEDNRECA